MIHTRSFKNKVGPFSTTHFKLKVGSKKMFKSYFKFNQQENDPKYN